MLQAGEVVKCRTPHRTYIGVVVGIGAWGANRDAGIATHVKIVCTFRDGVALPAKPTRWFRKSRVVRVIGAWQFNKQDKTWHLVKKIRRIITPKDSSTITWRSFARPPRTP